MNFLSGLISSLRIRNEAAVGVQGTPKRKGKKESQVVQLQIAHGLNQTYRMVLLCRLRFLQLQFKGLGISAAQFFLSPPPEGGLDLVTNRKGAI